MTHNDVVRRAEIAKAVELMPVQLADREVSQLMSFLYSLTDFGCVDLRSTIPDHLPSGLPLGRMRKLAAPILQPSL